jgi:hypothetical protein
MIKAIAIVFLWLSFFTLSAQNSSLYVNPIKDFELKADSSLAEWKSAQWILLPKREGKKEYSSRFKILYSETGVYSLFFCEDKIITSTLKEDFTNLYNEDVVEAFFWTDESFPVYFEYELSPTNYELPIIVPNNKGKFLGWLPWHYEGNRKTRHEAIIHQNKNWTAAFYIPYALLAPLGNVPPKKGTQWRCNFYRIDYDDQSTEWSWRPMSKTFHEFEKFGTVIFK